MDNLSPEKRRIVMQSIRSQDTLPERLVMRELRRLDIYFAKNVKTVLGKPDILFRRKKVAVFIDSDFWHGHPTRGNFPQTNADFWRRKIENNRARDKMVTCQLRKDGWTVIRIWEHDVKKKLDKVIDKIIKSVQKGRNDNGK